MAESDNNPLAKMQNQLNKLEKKEEQIKAQKKRIKNQMNQKKRKARTKRLIEKGAILEQFQGSESSEITPEQSLEQLKKLAQAHQYYELLKKYTKAITFNNGQTVFEGFLESQKENQ